MQDLWCETTSGITAFVGGMQKTTTAAGSEAKGLGKTNSNLRQGPNGDREATDIRKGWNRREKSGCRTKNDVDVYIRASRHALTVITESVDLSLVNQGWIGDKPCFMTVDAGA
jgi:hypothetical protein